MGEVIYAPAEVILCRLYSWLKQSTLNGNVVTITDAMQWFDRQTELVTTEARIECVEATITENRRLHDHFYNRSLLWYKEADWGIVAIKLALAHSQINSTFEEMLFILEGRLDFEDYHD